MTTKFVCFFRLPFSFVTEDVVNATCQCLFAQAIEAEKVNIPTFEIKIQTE